MTKEKAREITKALVDIEDFELFMEEIEKVCDEFELIDFEAKLLAFCSAELNRRKKVLEEL